MAVQTSADHRAHGGGSLAAGRTPCQHRPVSERAPDSASAAFESSGVYLWRRRGLFLSRPSLTPARGGGKGRARPRRRPEPHPVSGRARWLVDPGTFAYGSGEGERDVFREPLATTQCALMAPTKRSLRAVRLAVLSPMSRGALGHGKDFRSLGGPSFGLHEVTRPIIHRRCVFYLKSQFCL